MWDVGSRMCHSAAIGIWASSFEFRIRCSITFLRVSASPWSILNDYLRLRAAAANLDGLHLVNEQKFFAGKLSWIVGSFLALR